MSGKIYILPSQDEINVKYILKKIFLLYTFWSLSDFCTYDVTHEHTGSHILLTLNNVAESTVMFTDFE